MHHPALPPLMDSLRPDVRRVMVPVTDVWVADMTSALHPGCAPALLPDVGPPTHTRGTRSPSPGYATHDPSQHSQQGAGWFCAGRQAVRVMLTDDMASLGLQPGDLVGASHHPRPILCSPFPTLAHQRGS
jgi:hypothetical protein